MLKQRLADEQEQRQREHDAAIAELCTQHERAAAELRAEHEQQRRQLDVLGESAAGAEKAALEQLENARREGSALREQLAAEQAQAQGGGAAQTSRAAAS